MLMSMSLDYVLWLTGGDVLCLPSSVCPLLFHACITNTRTESRGRSREVAGMESVRCELLGSLSAIALRGRRDETAMKARNGNEGEQASGGEGGGEGEARFVKRGRRRGPPIVRVGVVGFWRV